MVKKELLDFFPPVDSSPIPQQHHRTVKMPEQVSEEGPDIQASEIPGATLDIKGQPPSFRGHGKGADGRNSVPLVEMVKEGRLPFRSPGAGDIGNEQKAAFIEKNQMGPKPFGVFLYGASAPAASVGWLPRPVAGRGAPVSGSSNLGFPEVSRRGRGDTELRTAGRSPWPRAVRSIDPSDNRRPGVPSGAPGPVCVSETRRAWADGQEWVAVVAPANPSLGKSGTSGIPNSPTRLWRGPPPTDSCPPLTVEWPVGVAFPTAGRFLGVSCPTV